MVDCLADWIAGWLAHLCREGFEICGHSDDSAFNSNTSDEHGSTNQSAELHLEINHIFFTDKNFIISKSEKSKQMLVYKTCKYKKYSHKCTYTIFISIFNNVLYKYN